MKIGCKSGTESESVVNMPTSGQVQPVGDGFEFEKYALQQQKNQ